MRTTWDLDDTRDLLRTHLLAAVPLAIPDALPGRARVHAREHLPTPVRVARMSRVPRSEGPSAQGKGDLMRTAGTAAIAGGVTTDHACLTIRPYDPDRYADATARNARAYEMERKARQAYIDAQQGKGTRERPAPKVRAPKPAKPPTERKPSPNGPDEATLRQWAALHRAGHNFAEVARMVGAPEHRVRRCLIARGHTAHTPNVDDAQLVAEYRAGDTYAVITARHGIGYQRLRTVLHNAGIQPRTPPLPPAQHHHASDAFAADHDAGLNVIQIAAKHGTDPRTVTKNLRRLGREPVPAAHTGRPAPLTPDDEQAIAHAYQDGATLDVVAARWRISRRRAGRIIRDHGVTIRPQLGRPTR